MYHGDIYKTSRERKNEKRKNLTWCPKDATAEIRAIACSDELTISYKKHARDRIAERGLIISDVLYALKYGFVYRDPLPSTRNGYNKYDIDSKTPNSGNREIRVIVIPDKTACALKIISVMWIDEKETITGSIVGENDG